MQTVVRAVSSCAPRARTCGLHPAAWRLGYTHAGIEHFASAAAAPQVSHDLQKCTVVDLKKQLKDLGLPVSGRKAELIERLTSSAPVEDAQRESKPSAAGTHAGHEQHIRAQETESASASSPVMPTDCHAGPEHPVLPTLPAPPENGLQQDNISQVSAESLSPESLRTKAQDTPAQVEEWRRQACTVETTDLGVALANLGRIRFDFDLADASTVQYLVDQVESSATEGWSEIGITHACYGMHVWPESRQATLLECLRRRFVELAEPLTSRGIGRSLYGLHRAPDGPALRSLLATLATKVDECPYELGSQTIGNALYGLQRCGDSPELCTILSALARKIEASTDELSGQTVGNSLYGLQGCSDSEELRLLLRTLSPKVLQCRDLNGLAFANAIHGLSFHGDTREVREVLTALEKAILRSEEPFNGKELTLAIRAIARLPDSAEGVQVLAAAALKISSLPGPVRGDTVNAILYSTKDIAKRDDNEAVRAILKSLALRLPEIDPFRAKDICRSLYGLQRRKNSPELRLILDAFAARIRSADGFSAQDVSMALYGLQRAGDSEETRGVLESLSPKIRACNDVFAAQSVGIALYGLRPFSNSAELEGMLASLAPKVAACQEQLSAQSVACSIYGLQRCSDCESLRSVLAGLVPKVEECAEELSDQEIGMALIGVQSFGDTSPEACALINALTRKVAAVETLLSGTRLDLIFAGVRGLCEVGGASDAARGLMAALIRRLPELGTAPKVSSRRTHAAATLVDALASVRSPEADTLRGVVQSYIGHQGKLDDAGSLPAGWSMHFHEDRQYYYHQDHGSQWTHPAASPKALPEGWAVHQTPEGRTYYHHPEVGSQWSHP